MHWAHRSASRFRAATPLQCSRLLRSLPSAKGGKEAVQYAVITSCAISRDSSRPSLRSPFQWSHVLRLIRKPASATMDFTPGPGVGHIQTREHGSHSHSHGHSHNHDNTYLTSTNKTDPGVRITKVGLYVNLGMAIAKGAGGIVFNSQA